MKAIPRFFLRLAAGAAAFLFVAFALLVLWLRYWGLPHIDEYRESIVTSISKASGMKASAQRLRGGWEGLRPFVSADGFALTDTRGRAALGFERAEATLSWWALLFGRVRFHDVDFHRPALALRRGADGLVYLGEKPLNAAGPEGDGAFTEWLLAQPQIGIHEATLTWRDEKTGAPEVALSGVEIMVEKRHGRHLAALSAVPPRELAGRIEMRADVFLVRDGGRWRGAGEAYAESRNADLAKIRAHLPLPETLRSGVGSIRVWTQFNGDAVREVVADLSMRDAVGQLASDALPLNLATISGRARYSAEPTGFTVGTENLKFRLAGGPEILPGNFTISRSAEAGKPGRLEVKADGIDLKIAATLLDYFPVPRDVKAQVQRFAPRGRIRNASLTWEQGGATRAYKVKGSFEDLAANAVDAMPGFSGLTGSIDGNESGGTLELASRNSRLELDRIFRAPLGVDTLEARASWKHVGNAIEVTIAEARFANADAEGALTGTWRSHPDSKERSPGVLDLKGSLTRANAQAVANYLPNRASNTRDWLDRAIQAGTSPRVTFELKGDLVQFPFGGDSTGRFLVEGDIVNGRLKYHPEWPPVDNVNGTFRFENRRMEIRAQRATIFASKATGVSAEIDDLLGKPPVLTILGDIDTSGADSVRFLRESPLVKGPGAFTRVVAVDGPGKVHLQLVYPLATGETVRVLGDYTFAGATASVARTLAMKDMRGKLTFTNRSVAAPEITGTLFGRPATLTMSTLSEGTIVTQVDGSIDSAGLAAYVAPSLAARLEGATPWSAKLTTTRQGNELVITSSLSGIASTLPAPFAKAAAEQRPTSFTIAAIGTDNEVGTLAMGTIHGRFTHAGEERWNAALKFGSPVASEPMREGLWLYGELASLDIDAWQATFGAGRGMTAPAPQPQAIELRGVDMRLARAHYWGRDFASMHATLTRSGSQWRGRLESPAVAGDVDWNWEGKGRLVARFDRLAVTDPATPATEAQKAELTDLPALDVTAQKFDFRGKWLGALDLKAEPAGEEWRIDKLDISTDHAKFTSKGGWRRTGTGSLTTLNLELETTDLNKVFAQFGYGDYMKRGNGSLEGTLVWPGYPHEFAIASLAGSFKVEARGGQFAKIEPGAGKILGLLSLQSLPRRAMFDFRDVFSAGFAFEKIHGDVKVAKGVLVTDNFEIDGPSAFVSMSGEVSIPQETQTLTMHVVPEIGEGLALAATLVGTPVLGLSTLLVTKLLKNPLGKAVAYEYQVTGSWDNPQVVRTSAAPPPKTAANPELPAARTQQQ